MNAIGKFFILVTMPLIAVQMIMKAHNPLPFFQFHGEELYLIANKYHGDEIDGKLQKLGIKKSNIYRF